MFLPKKNSDPNKSDNTELLDSAVANAVYRRNLTLDQNNDVSELDFEETSLVIGGCCCDPGPIIITCGMYCDHD